MVYFDREKTEMIVFDLEFYVPPKDRNKKGASLLANPNKDGHYLLGGVFTKYKPFKDKDKNLDSFDYQHFWVWKEGNEKKVLEKIYNYIINSWEDLKDKDPKQADLMFYGVGISRFDIPVLYIRSTYHKIAPSEDLFECYFKAKQLDLSNIAIPFFNRDQVMYPKSVNSIFRRFGIKKEKESGINVWDMYDKKDYIKIEKRTENEVKDSIVLYRKISTKIYTKNRNEEYLSKNNFR